jgi:hypothetical protein
MIGGKMVLVGRGKRGASFVGLLDLYPNAAAAYSVRRLSGTYEGALIEVRRSSDNAVQNIGFDTNGDLNTSALLSFVGAGDGFVRTWYDQSGNSNDSTQTTSASQPKIVDDGVLVTENGKPALDFDGSNDHLVSTSAYPTQAYQSTFYVAFSNGFNNRILDTRGVGGVGTVQGWQHKYSASSPTSDITIIDDGLVESIRIDGITRTGQNLVSIFMYGGGGSSIDEYTNGSLSKSGTNVNNIDFNSGNRLYIGANTNGANSQLFGGKIQDIILYNTDESAKKVGIEQNINDFYNIY